MIKLGNAIERALVKLVDDLAEFIETLPPDDPKQRGRRIHVRGWK